jgi:hypothetical protein
MITRVLDVVPGWAWALALAGALGFGWWQYDEKRDFEVDLAGARLDLSRVETDLSNQKLTATRQLLDETRRANNAELKLQAARDEAQRLGAESAQTSKSLSLALADLARAKSGRLRDPNVTATRCGGSGNSAKAAASIATIDRTENPAETTGLLSPQLTQLLRTEADANDGINDAYAACRAYTIEVNEIVKEFNERK